MWSADSCGSWSRWRSANMIAATRRTSPRPGLCWELLPGTSVTSTSTTTSPSSDSTTRCPSQTPSGPSACPPTRVSYLYSSSFLQFRGGRHSILPQETKYSIQLFAKQNLLRWILRAFSTNLDSHLLRILYYKLILSYLLSSHHTIYQQYSAHVWWTQPSSYLTYWVYTVEYYLP